MKTSKSANELAFSLRFYEQVQGAIDSVVAVALKANPGITGWTQNTDRGGTAAVVVLNFRDKAAIEAFRRDEAMIHMYLALAWGKQALGRDALRVKPSGGDERGTIPGDMFAHVGI